MGPSMKWWILPSVDVLKLVIFYVMTSESSQVVLSILEEQKSVIGWLDKSDGFEGVASYSTVILPLYA